MDIEKMMFSDEVFLSMFSKAFETDDNRLYLTNDDPMYQGLVIWVKRNGILEKIIIDNNPNFHFEIAHLYEIYRIGLKDLWNVCDTANYFVDNIHIRIENHKRWMYENVIEIIKRHSNQFNISESETKSKAT